MTPIQNSADCLCKIHTVDTKRSPDGANKIMFTLKLQKSKTKLFFCKMWHYRSQDDVSRTGIGLSKVLGMIYPPKTRQWKKSSYADKHCDVSCLAPSGIRVLYLDIYKLNIFIAPYLHLISLTWWHTFESLLQCPCTYLVGYSWISSSSSLWVWSWSLLFHCIWQHTESLLQ